MQLLQMMMDTGQLDNFVIGMYEAVDEEKMWEFYLYKVKENITFDTFKAQQVQQPVETSKNDLEATVKHSLEMMENFHPEE